MTSSDVASVLTVRKNKLVVVPHYDSGLSPTSASTETGEGTKVGHIYLPIGSRNPISQQGKVLASGVSDIAVGDHVLYEPYQGQPFRYNGVELLCYRSDHVVCTVDQLSGRPMPRADYCVIAPIWEPGAPHLQGLIYIPDVAEKHAPQVEGRIVRCGPAVREVLAGQRVVLPPRGGFEVAYIDHVTYFIRETDLLAILL